ncbi:alpha/beta hydrolase [Xanthomonas campestris]|uniref:alpha/beta hydrolase n=1 Tax=Xanthomonas campestris TaxID=339 RepID=UPI0023E9D0FF|nr:hypothetical protein [Xanthomonas campestris]
MQLSRNVQCLSIAALLWCAGLSPLCAQPDLSRTIGTTVADRPSDSYRFSQLRLAATDGQRHYRVRIAVPKTPPPPAGYPVVYLLDGNAALMELDAPLLDGLSAYGDAPVLVFIGDDSALRIDAVGRSLDYTPARYGDGRVETDPLAPQRRNGGAAAFLQLIETRIRPQVQARAAVDRKRQTLWGHSYAGLFVLHTLLTRPQAFQRYVAVDPSLWWGDGFIVEQAQRVVQQAAGTSQADAAPIQFMLMAGEPNGEANPPAADRPGRPRADPQAARQLVTLLSTRPEITATYRPLPGLSHGQTLGASLAPTLQAAAGR